MELLGAYSCPWRPESWKVTIGEVMDSRAFERGSVRSRREGARGGQVVDIKRRRRPRRGAEAKCGKVLVRRELVAPGGLSAEVAFGRDGIRSVGRDG